MTTPLPKRVPGATITEVGSFRQIPARCHCGWAVRIGTGAPGAVWQLREPFAGCPVHGQASPQIS